jgi:hypothetical protein
MLLARFVLCLIQIEIKMMYQTETKSQYRFYSSWIFTYLSAIFLFALSATVFAATDSSAKSDEYVDSVYSWGIWELGIEPAAGPQAPANRALNNRARSLQFRPNDNAAFKIESVAIPAGAPVNPPPSIPAPAFGSGVIDRANAPTGGPGGRFK